MRLLILVLVALPISQCQIPMDYDYLDDEPIGNELKIAEYSKEIAEKNEKLIAELLQNGGKWMLRTYKGRYISGQKDTSCSWFCSSNSVTKNGGAIGIEPRWTIERKTDTKVVFKASNGKYMCDDTGPFTGVVKLVDDSSSKCVLWTPVKNDDGSWSFKNGKNGWLSAHRTDFLVVTMDKKLACEKFWLESW